MGGQATSVILATVRWTHVIGELGEQLGPDDELLVVCDSDDDPVASRVDELPPGARLVVAGQPTGCSGKANAIAAGMEAASNDLLVWTDDDFEHPPDWLDQLRADYAEHGPVSELPAFVGKDPLALLLEPEYVVNNAIGLYGSDQPWGGAVMFHREDLSVDVDAFVTELRSTISDDGLLAEYLDVTVVRRTRRVEIGGSIRASLERHVRWTKIVYRHAPTWQLPIYLAITFLTTVAAVLYPLEGFVVATVLAAGLYAFFGVRRWTFLLAYPVLVLDSPLLCYGLARRTFVWGGRRYRWSGKFDVQIEGAG